jgi:tyrosine-protein phosphatase SIW14
VRLNTTLVRAYTFALLLAWLAPVAAGQPVDTGNPSDVTTDVSRIDIDNFGRVNDRYYRGAQPEGGDYADLAAIGVKTLINLTGNDSQADEKRMVERAGMKYFQIPMTTQRQPTSEQVAQFLSIVTDPASQPVYVHCVGGRHRTGVMTAVYRMTEDGWTADRAFNEMKQFKFGPDFLHPAFKRFVYSYRADMMRTQRLATPTS